MKRKGVKITSAILKRAGACSDFRNRFRKRFPKGVYVTPELCVKFALHPLFCSRWEWAITHLLNVPSVPYSAYGTPAPLVTTFAEDRIVRGAVNAVRFGALVQHEMFRNRGVFSKTV